MFAPAGKEIVRIQNRGDLCLAMAAGLAAAGLAAELEAAVAPPPPQLRG